MTVPNWRMVVMPLLAVVFGLIVGAILIVVSGDNPLVAYGGMVEGSLGGSDAIGRTLEKATPLVLGGLAVAFAFKAGLFNIGGQGQLLLGAAFSAWVGFNFDLPAVIHIPAALIVGGLAAAVLGGLAGLLKATRGVHEVISTIMLNFVAANFTEWLVSRDGPWKDPEGGAIARTPLVQDSADLPRVAGLPTGFLVAVLAAVSIWWLVNRSTLGFEVKTVGSNPKAAAYAGISVTRIIVITMGISAFLAGLGGGIQTLGVNGRFEPGFQTGLGFDGITIALLARTNALAVIPAALLIGAMDAGSTLMQARTDVEPEVINVIQAMILFFVAAPSVVRWILQLSEGEDVDTGVDLATGWGTT
ncbi:MAG: ABC transporter permease [Acidimicrobiia bacterium]|nr:ABC transporter permease [Acidimicrobiia bacterium]